MLMVTSPANSKLLLCFLLYTSSCCFLLTHHAAADAVVPPVSFSFDFSNRSSYRLDELRFEGNASLHGELVDLTCTSAADSKCMGRMSYNHPVTLYDSATGEVASCATRFNFAIKNFSDAGAIKNFSDAGAIVRGDGMTFFLCSYPSTMPPMAWGGSIGLYHDGDTFDPERFVAVEFDPFKNSFDTQDHDHIGIDINSVGTSPNTTALPANVNLTGSMTASVMFDGRTCMLVASLRFDDHRSLRPVEVSTQLTSQQITSLPSEVAVGFSAATGSTKELHQIMSWSFNSTLAPRKGKNSSGSRLLGIILPILGVAAIAAISLCVWSTIRRKRRSRRPSLSSQPHRVDDLESVKSSLLSLSSLQEATDNFDESNKLGEGGFGTVYKGVLSGLEVAVKRMSKGSNQGLEELKNELVLVAKLHHKNLVRLVGFSLEAGERLLVYEYMPNKSLDTILFDPEEKRRLDWATRYKIIEGVARGLQYLHEDSQRKIIHRDMKASNVLLDVDMSPKIGDFGLARLFGQDQTREVTSRIVGTFGYMSPEYVMRGQYSIKLDVYSFGILVIEIVTGQRNNGSYLSEENEDLISIVWKHWTEGTIAEMVDYSLGRNYPGTEVLKCVHIGLLCIQQNPIDRPTMSEIMVMLNCDATSSLPAAGRPTFFLDGTSGFSQSTTSPLYTDSLTSGR